MKYYNNDHLKLSLVLDLNFDLSKQELGNLEANNSILVLLGHCVRKALNQLLTEASTGCY